MALDFYHGHGSPYSWRVWLALEHKQVPYNLKVLSFADKDTTKPEFVAINPRHTVPTIVDDGHAVWESLAILEYLDERFASGPKLFPGDAKERARVRRLIQEMVSYLDHEGMDPITDELFSKPAVSRPTWSGLRKARRRCARSWRGSARSCAATTSRATRRPPPTSCSIRISAYCWRINFRKPEAGMADILPAPMAALKKRDRVAAVLRQDISAPLEMIGSRPAPG